MTTPADVSSQRPGATPAASSGTTESVKPQAMPMQPATHAPQPQPGAAGHAQPAPGPAPQPTPAAASSAPAAAKAAPQSAPPAATQTRPAPPAKPTRGPVSRFFRSLFSHLLFAGVAVAGVLGYIYHQPILRDVSNTVCADTALGQWMDKSHGMAAAKPATVVSPAAAPQPAAPATTPPVAAAPTAPPATPPAATPTPVAPQASSAAPATQAASPPAAPAPAAPTPAPTDTAKPAKESKPAPSAAVTPSPAAASAALDAGKSAAPIPGGESKAAGSSLEDLRKALAEAREAYSAGKPEAVATYSDLAQRFPDNPDVTGELGNILYQQGKLTEAGEQFYETALRLIRAKQEPRAACLVEIIRQLNPARARDLEAKTTATCPVPANR
ncbi:MAG: tetratricopeptide repeat protein [Hyphomicrobiaceae bacterium]|nr:tetratricopeptide repeat protein [Hyphomicrobiaceae bacterium]